MSSNRRFSGYTNHSSGARGHESHHGYGNSSMGRKPNPWANHENSGITNTANLLSTVTSLSSLADPQTQIAIACNLINLVANSAVEQRMLNTPSLLSMGPMRPNSNDGRRMVSNYGSYERDRFDRRANLRDQIAPKRSAAPVRYQGNNRYQRPVDRNQSSFNKRQQKVTRDFKKTAPSAKVEEQAEEIKSGKSNNVPEKSNNVSGKSKNVSGKSNNVSGKSSNVSEKSSNVSGKSNNVSGKSNNVSEANNEKHAENIKTDKSIYANVLPVLYYCHVCKKQIWDYASFEKHIDGSLHRVLMGRRQQMYELRVRMLRHDCVVWEQQRENVITKLRLALGPDFKNSSGFCPMCDLKYDGLSSVHRKNETHQKLKRYLHPKCTLCDEEFSVRRQWDEHRLSAAHLEKLSELCKNIRPETKSQDFVEVIDFIEDVHDEMEMGIEIKPSGYVKLKPIQRNGEGEDAQMAECEDSLLDNKEPKESGPGEKWGEKFVQKVSGFLCITCRRFLLNEGDYKAHFQSANHLACVKKITTLQEQSARKRQSNVKKKEQANEEDIMAVDTHVSDGDESDSVPESKRLKMNAAKTQRDEELGGKKVSHDFDDSVAGEEEIDDRTKEMANPDAGGSQRGSHKGSEGDEIRKESISPPAKSDRGTRHRPGPKRSKVAKGTKGK